MFEEAILREHFQALLAQESRAADAYASLAASLKDPALRQQVQQLYHDKQRHVHLVERLLEIVQ